MTPFDPLTSEFAADPYSDYAALRAHNKLAYYEPYDMWLVPWHAEVSQVLRMPTMVRSLDGLISEEQRRERQIRDNWHDMPYHSRFVQFSMLDSDGDLHERLRSLIARDFTPRVVEQLRTNLQTFVEAQLDRVAKLEQFDFIEDFAARIPGQAIGALMGMPEDDCDQLRRWSEDIVQYFDVDRSDARKQLAEATTFTFYRYLDQLKRHRLQRPQNDLLTRLGQLEADGKLTEDECISSCMLIVMAGHGSTLDVLGSGLHTLLRFPEQMTRLRNDGALLPTAVQEMFRFEPPLPFFHRYTTTPTRLRQQEFAAGTRFGLLYGSANRDESVFDHADQFDVGRRPNQHRSFGGGEHFCLGNHLAKMTLEVVLERMLARFGRIELLSNPEYKTGLSVRGPKQLLVSVTPH